MQHAKHVIIGALAFAVIFLPAAIADPAVASILSNHPAIAGYFGAAVGVAHALVKALGSPDKP